MPALVGDVRRSEFQKLAKQRKKFLWTDPIIGYFGSSPEFDEGPPCSVQRQASFASNFATRGFKTGGGSETVERFEVTNLSRPYAIVRG
jgi:hypothetical protein